MVKLLMVASPGAGLPRRAAGRSRKVTPG